jgi:hypothetical protein
MTEDPDKRIEELEQQVQDLRAAVRTLVAERTAPRDRPHTRVEHFAHNASEAGDRVRHRVVEQVERALGGQAGESLESRIGGIWLSRIGVVLLMATIAFFAAYTFDAAELTPLHKILVFYAMAAVGIVGGILGRRHNVFADAILGSGLAILYFTTFAGFYLEQTRVFPNLAYALPALVACLVVLVTVAHWRRSQSVAGIALFLVYLSVILSCYLGVDLQTMTYALITCSMLAITAFLFHLLHRWLLFTWIAMIATYAAYIYFFVPMPRALDMPREAYFWLANGFLTLCWVLFSAAAITDARKTGEYRRTVAPMAGVNSAIYLTLTWFAIRTHYLQEEWLFRLAFAIVLAIMAIYAETTGPRRNYLFQIFVAKTVIMLTLALQALLAPEWLLVAMAIECLGLAFAYKRSGIVIFKVLGLALLLVTFVGAILSVKMAGAVAVAGYVFPANWFACLAAAAVFCLVAWFYDHFVHRVRPQHRTVSGQWFLADTLVDLRSSTAAMLHAAAAALIVLTLLIIEFGDDPRCPYILAAAAVIMASLGFLLRTLQVEVGAVLLLVASHVCFYAFLLLGLPGFITQQNYALYTVLLALFTYFGAHVWERYLRRVDDQLHWEHHGIAAIPYLAATVMLATLLAQRLDSIHVPLSQNALGVTLLLAGSLSGYAAVKASGVVAIAIGTVTFYIGLYEPAAPITMHPDFLVCFVLFLSTYAAGERLLHLLGRGERAPARAQDGLRTVLVTVLAVVGMLTLYVWAPHAYLTVYWLLLAVIVIAAGALVRESRYRWIGLAVLLLAIVRAFAVDVRTMAPLYRLISFAALTAAVMIVAWAYSHYRTRSLRKPAPKPLEPPAPHESAAQGS